MFWTDHGAGSRTPRFEELEAWVDVLESTIPHRPVIAHNIGLSIGNAGSFDLEYVAHLAAWQQRYRFPWQSDHLSFAEVTAHRWRRAARRRGRAAARTTATSSR